jgi:hypothetical protein
MDQRSGSASGNTGGISVGGNVEASILSTGHHNTQEVTYKKVAGTGEERDQVLEALRQIRAALEELSGPYAKPAKVNADAALDAASAGEPDKDAVGGALETALEAAKKSAEFMGTAATLAPYLQTAASWLGSSWGHLVNLL